MKPLFLSIIFTALSVGYFLISAGTAEAYSFIVAGHVYGTPGVDHGGLYPTFLRNILKLSQKEKISFGVLTGDVVIDSTAENWDEAQRDLSALGFPVYISPGNHDLNDGGALFKERIGELFFSFDYEGNRFIFLNSNNGDSSGILDKEQLSFLKNRVDSTDEHIDNIFIFVHHLIWWDERFSDVQGDPFAGSSVAPDFWKNISPIFLMSEKQVFIFAGDAGRTPLEVGFSYHQTKNLHLIGSGMGDSIDENFLVVNVDSTGEVVIRKILLRNLFYRTMKSIFVEVKYFVEGIDIYWDVRRILRPVRRFL